jgi:predicted transcriptional regulator
VAKRKRPRTEVFLNILYDKKFERLFVAYIAGISAFGLIPRATLEIADSSRSPQHRYSRLEGSCNAEGCEVLFRIMSTLKTISFRLPAEAVETLDALAARMDRDRTHLLNEAVERYLELNEYHIKLIEKGLRASAEGDFVPDAEMKKLIARIKRKK